MSRPVDSAAIGHVVVRFDAELVLVGDEIPETLNYAELAQAVQNETGYSGVKVIEVTEWEQKP